MITSLGRARAKNDIDTIKPLRRLRRNQGAINEALIDALSALIAVNKQMAGEIAGLSGELATLRQQLAERNRILEAYRIDRALIWGKTEKGSGLSKFVL